MQKDDQAPLVFGLVLPLILALIISLAPSPWAMTAAMDNARQAADNHLPAQAAGYLRQAVQYVPWRAELWIQIAGLELQAGNPANAITAFEQAAQVGSLSPAQQQTLGEAYLAVNDPASADTGVAGADPIRAGFARYFRAVVGCAVAGG